MFEYMTVQEASKKWELSERRIQKLCADNRIDGVIHLSGFGSYQRVRKSRLTAGQNEERN